MPTLRCRLIVVGDATVGKTALINQFAELGWPKTYQMTQGIDYKVKGVKIPDTDFVVEFHILELGGNPIYRDFVPQMCDKANFVMYLYDAGNKMSFENIKQWTNLVADNTKDKTPQSVLVGNKIDIEGRSLVSKEQGQALAETIGAEHFQVSAVFLQRPTENSLKELT